MFEFFISPNCIRDYKLTRKLNSDMRSFDKWMHHCREIIEEELKKEWKDHNIDRRYRKKLLGHIRCKCSFKIKLKGTHWHKVPGVFVCLSFSLWFWRVFTLIFEFIWDSIHSPLKWPNYFFWRNVNELLMQIFTI